MMEFLKGGNWGDSVYVGLLNINSWLTLSREIIPLYGFDREGLPERWVKILMGETNWIPLIVFKMNAEKKKRKLRP